MTLQEQEATARLASAVQMAALGFVVVQWVQSPVEAATAIAELAWDGFSTSSGVSAQQQPRRCGVSRAEAILASYPGCSIADIDTLPATSSAGSSATLPLGTLLSELLKLSATTSSEAAVASAASCVGAPFALLRNTALMLPSPLPQPSSSAKVEEAPAGACTPQ